MTQHQVRPWRRERGPAGRDPGPSRGVLRLHVVDQLFWITAVGPLGGLAVLDDIERILAAR